MAIIVILGFVVMIFMLWSIGHQIEAFAKLLIYHSNRDRDASEKLYELVREWYREAERQLEEEAKRRVAEMERR